LLLNAGKDYSGTGVRAPVFFVICSEIKPDSN
jgi:hypothetical protein